MRERASVPPHGGSSISSFEPGDLTFGFVRIDRHVGSFCLFWGTGVGGLPVFTSASVAAWAAAGAANASSNPMTADTVEPRLNMDRLLCPAN